MATSTRIRFMRPFANRVVNPVTRLFAGRLPGFAILTCVGRTSGRMYELPINVFRHGDRYTFALTYGSNVDWVKNVLVAGGCSIRERGRDIRLVEPVLVHDPELAPLPLPVRAIAHLIGVTELLSMRSE